MDLFPDGVHFATQGRTLNCFNNSSFPSIDMTPAIFSRKISNRQVQYDVRRAETISYCVNLDFVDNRRGGGTMVQNIPFPSGPFLVSMPSIMAELKHPRSQILWRRFRRPLWSSRLTQYQILHVYSNLGRTAPTVYRTILHSSPDQTYITTLHYVNSKQENHFDHRL